MIEVARKYVASGLSVIPVNVKTKRPAIKSWKAYQSRLPSDAELQEWFPPETTNSIAIVTGKISGNLELLDFDFKGEMAKAWRRGVPPELLKRLVIESSQSGGFHVLYRCAGPVQKNLKLAQRGVLCKENDPYVYCDKEIKPVKKADGRFYAVFTLIETRGEGGYFICYPSPGYDLKQGAIEAIQTLTVDERKDLVSAARACNKWKNPVSEAPPKPKKEKPLGGGKQPGDDYNMRGDLLSLLLSHGFKDTGRNGVLETGGNARLLTRPGKNGGPSASIIDDAVLYVFSSNCPPFESDKGYSAFHAFALLECSGDFSAAARKLAELGYGDKDLIEPDWSDVKAYDLGSNYVKYKEEKWSDLEQINKGGKGDKGDKGDKRLKLGTKGTKGTSETAAKKQGDKKPLSPSKKVQQNQVVALTNAHDTPTHVSSSKSKPISNISTRIVPATAEIPEQENCLGYSPRPENQNQNPASIAPESQEQDGDGPRLQDEYRDWLHFQDEFKIEEFYRYANIQSRAAKKAISKVNSRLIELGEVERAGARGVFRVARVERKKMDWLNADERSVDITLPLDLHDLVKIQPGNIIVFAGEPNSGKTAFLMDIAMNNVDKFRVNYFSSEMGDAELKSRIFGFRDIYKKKFPSVPVVEKFMAVNFEERTDHFADVIIPGEGNLNIIDFMEIHEDFYKVGAYIAQIHNKLDGAIAVIAIQKDKMKDFGKGGMVTAEKPRLYVNLGYDPAKNESIAHIIKAKSWANPTRNPNHLKCVFEVVNGAWVKKAAGKDWRSDERNNNNRPVMLPNNDQYWEGVGR